MSRPNKWQDHWLDIKSGGLPLKKWCTNSTKHDGYAHCRVCNLTLKYLFTGVGVLKRHGSSKKHLDNLKNLVDLSKAKSAETSSVPTLKERRKKELHISTDFKKAKYINQVKQRKLSSLNPRPSTIYEAGDAFLGPVPYFQVTNNEPRNVLIPVYPCCYCPKELMSKDLLHDHQTTCIMKPPVLQAVLPSEENSVPSVPEYDAPPTISSVMGESQLQNLPESPSSAHRALLSKSDFIAGLDLLPKKKAQRVSKRRRNTECESIDWEVEVPITPTTPSSCRTPKLLISHLSRDGQDNYRRRLSFSVDGKANKEKDQDGNEDDNQAHEEQEKKMTVFKSLYNLDVTSLLGQFVIKHFKGDPSLHILSDIESHCLTSTPSPKNSSVSRLRVRNVVYPITFRSYLGKFSGSFAHQYKFNKKQVREFMRTVETGLDKLSRILRRQMKPCRVMLKPLTKADLKQWIPSQKQPIVDLQPLSSAEIAFWTMPKPPSPDAISIFPKGLSFTSPDIHSILGLRTRQNQTSSRLKTSSLSLGNFVSEEVCAELIQNRKVLYRSLLSDCSSKESCLSESENRSPIHHIAYPVLRQMLNPSVNLCDVKNSNIDQNDSLVPSKDVNCDQKHKDIAIKENKTLLEGKKLNRDNIFDSLLHLTPGDKISGNQSSDEPHIKKRKLASSTSACIKEVPKFLRGFSVHGKAAKGAEGLKSLPESPESVSSKQSSDRSERAFRRMSRNRIRSPEYHRTNGLSSRSKTLRSSRRKTLSIQPRKDVRGKGKIMGSCMTNRSLNTSSNFNSIRRTGVLATNNSVKEHLKKDNIVQQKTGYYQDIKCEKLISANAVGGQTPERPRLSSASASLLRRRLSAAGLVKRELSRSESVPIVSGKQPKPTVPIPNQSPLTPKSSSTTLSDSGISASSPDDNRSTQPQRQSSQHTPLRKSKSQSRACIMEQSSRLTSRSRRKQKDQKHRSFLLWLQNLKKGNIT